MQLIDWGFLVHPHTCHYALCVTFPGSLCT